MASWDINGAWIGEYCYNPTPTMAELPPPTTFTMEVTRGYLGRWRGTIQDDLARGAFQPATMIGRVCRTTVWFRKQYPVEKVYHQGRVTTLEEQLKAEWGMPLDSIPAASPIWYRGRYDEERELVEGTWRIKPRVVYFRARGRLHGGYARGESGTWHMRRIASPPRLPGWNAGS